MNESELRAALKELVPEAPVVARAVAARQRAGRAKTERWVGVVAVAAVVIVAIVLPTLVFDDGHELSTPAAKQVSVSCPPTHGDFAPSLVGPSTVERGAVVVRLCSVLGGETWSPPRDELRIDVDALVEVINSADLHRQPERRCPRVGTVWGYQFGYPNGSTQWVTAGEGGCAGVYVRNHWRGGRTDAVALFEAFRDRLLTQRETLTPPTPTAGMPRAPLSCAIDDDASWVTMTSLPTEVPVFDVANLCVSRIVGGAVNVRTIPVYLPADLKALNADLLESSGPLPQKNGVTSMSCVHRTMAYVVVGRDAWGDSRLLRATCGGYEVARGRYWNPSSAVIAMFDRLRHESGVIEGSGPVKHLTLRK